jgi:hypothetical protein
MQGEHCADRKYPPAQDQPHDRPAQRDHPQALLVDLERLALPDLGSVRVALAVSLFRSGAVSAGFAARMTGKPLPEMLTLLSSLGIPLTGANPADAREDLDAGRQWLARKV